VLYTYKEILKYAKRLLNTHDFKGLFIDPYNSLEIETDNKLSEHTYHYQVASQLKLFASQNNIAIYLNSHVVTNATRGLSGENEIPAPKKGDVEGGSKWANKATDFLVIHRHVNIEDKKFFTEVHVRKIKETETGGCVTPFNSPVKFKSMGGLVGFRDEDDVNPITKFIAKKHGTIKDTYGSRPLTPIRDITEPKRDENLIEINGEMIDTTPPF